MKKIALVHPELIIGGAERLMLDLCLALKANSFEPVLYCGFLNKNNCFKEVVDGSIDVRVHGNIIPKKIFGKFQALFSIIRMIYVSSCLLCSVLFHLSSYDLIICDQVSVVIPLLKLTGKPVWLICFCLVMEFRYFFIVISLIDF
jgi:alpha-1,3/alpha-1,6-mannosyltransferase